MTTFEFGDVIEIVCDGEITRGIFLKYSTRFPDVCDIAEEDGYINFDIWIERVKFIRKGNFKE